MPTLPLYDSTAHPDAWHNVIAPGGYELWSFEVDDPTNGLGLLVSVVEGDNSPRGLRAFLRYLRRPTKVNPPKPGDCLQVRVAVTEQGKSLCDVVVRQPEGSLLASTRSLDLKLGPCEIRGDIESGSVRVVIYGLRATPADLEVDVEMLLRPTEMVVPNVKQIAGFGPPMGFLFQSETSSRYDVSGVVRLSTAVNAVRAFELNGIGRHRHHFTTGPVGF